MKRALQLLLIVGAFGAALAGGTAAAQDETDPCTAPGLLTKNCRFQRPVYGVSGFGVVYNGWSPYIASGTPQFDANYHGNSYDPDDMVNGGREQSIYNAGRGPWRGGLFQRIEGVTPGRAYYAKIGWFVAAHYILGRVGIDPDGGTDPNSPAIVWSQPLPIHRATQHKVRGVYARSPTITVFVDATVPGTSGSDDRLWLTAVAAGVDAVYAPAAPPTATSSPTNTPRPLPTRTATPRPPTATPTALATATATPTATPTSTESPTATPTATPTETPTPEPTPTRRVRSTPTPTPAPEADLTMVAGVALSIAGAGGCGLLGMASLGGVTWVAWRRMRRT